MTKQELITWLESKGYTKDSYGHYQKTTPDGRAYRYKIQASSARYERQATILGKHEWIRIVSGYYKDLSINDKGQLSGMKV
jgi:hypothetical protein